MSELRFQRRLAAQILKCGENRIWINPDALEDVASASTKEDVRELIESGVIKRKPIKGISRARINAKKAQRRKGRGRGHGRRKGKKTARMPRKEQWMIRIRAIRRRLRYLRDTGVIDRRTYRMLYMKAKGGEFRSVAYLNAYLQTQGILNGK
ncbi:MAG: 50S ribosomal protein L19e [Archaeoglobus sp.]|nr:MAG: 50S ribosomal protein L19e [Archaeoglobus sp.]